MKQLSELIQKLKCFFGFHDLIVSEEEQKRLDDAMKEPFNQMIGLNRMSDGTEIIFKICTKCGAKR
jgi:hypothetical protein